MDGNMTLYRILTTCTLLLSATVQAGDYCRGKPAGWPEIAICADADLHALDQSLNHHYERARRTITNKTLLRDQQKQWLAQVRNKCRNKECLTRVYNKRIAELDVLYVSALPVSAKPLDNQEARNICQSVATLADQKHLADLELPGINPDSAETQNINDAWKISAEEKTKLDAREETPPTGYINTMYLLRLKPSTSPVRFARFFTGGTCASYETFSIPYLLSNPEDNGAEPVDMSDDEDRFLYWGNGDYPVFYRGRNLLITADIANPNKVKMVSWIKPDGKKRPLCLLNVENSGMSVVAASNNTLCKDIVRGTTQPLSWQPLDNLPYGDHEQFTARYGAYAHGIETLNIDFDADGILDNIGRFIYESGAGCGSTNVWLSVLSKNLEKTEQGRLNDQLKTLYDGPMDIYRVEGRYYITATSSEAKGNGLLHINGDGIKQVCEFEQETKTTVSQFFPVEP